MEINTQVWSLFVNSLTGLIFGRVGLWNKLSPHSKKIHGLSLVMGTSK